MAEVRVDTITKKHVTITLAEHEAAWVRTALRDKSADDGYHTPARVLFMSIASQLEGV